MQFTVAFLVFNNQLTIITAVKKTINLFLNTEGKLLFYSAVLKAFLCPIVVPDF